MFTLLVACWTSSWVASNFKYRNTCVVTVMISWMWKIELSRKTMQNECYTYQNAVKYYYSTVNFTKYAIQHNNDKFWTHKRHPISHSPGRTTGYLFWVFLRKLTILSWDRTSLLFFSWLVPGNTAGCCFLISLIARHLFMVGLPV